MKLNFAVARMEQLVDLGRSHSGAGYQIRSKSTLHFPDIERGEVILCWRDESNFRRELPSVVVTNNGDLENFLAWTATYVNGLKPLTAHCRVITARHADRYLHNGSAIHGVTPLNRAGVALVLCEAMAYLTRQADVSLVPVIAIERTFSFLMTRATNVGVASLEGEKELLARWSMLRSSSGTAIPTGMPKALEDVWTVLIAAFADDDGNAAEHTGVDPLAIELCREVADGIASNRTIEKLVADRYPRMKLALEKMNGSREDRVDSFERLRSAMYGEAYEHQANAALLLGYLASKIAPGTLDHLPMLIESAGRMPSAIFWYGVFAALPMDSDVLATGGGTAQRIWRDATRPASIFDRPTCDLAFEELEVLGRLGNIETMVPVLRPGYLEVEVAPCVDAVVRMQRHTAGQEELFESDAKPVEIAFSADKLDSIIADLYDLQKRLREIASGRRDDVEVNKNKRRDTSGLRKQRR